ncbi:MAG TPA: hypothetical protein VMV36_01600 [Ignavibacteriaceae bacterium]|nr:hypothetical protein [Ignavibacteriaceae bacterium]
MDYKVLRANRELVRGFLSGRIKNAVKEGIRKEDVIEYYKSILDEMKNEKLFQEEL